MSTDIRYRHTTWSFVESEGNTWFIPLEHVIEICDRCGANFFPFLKWCTVYTRKGTNILRSRRRNKAVIIRDSSLRSTEDSICIYLYEVTIREVTYIDIERIDQDSWSTISTSTSNRSIDDEYLDILTSDWNILRSWTRVEMISICCSSYRHKCKWECIPHIRKFRKGSHRDDIPDSNCTMDWGYELYLTSRMSSAVSRRVDDVIRNHVRHRKIDSAYSSLDFRRPPYHSTTMIVIMGVHMKKSSRVSFFYMRNSFSFWEWISEILCKLFLSARLGKKFFLYSSIGFAVKKVSSTLKLTQSNFIWIIFLREKIMTTTVFPVWFHMHRISIIFEEYSVRGIVSREYSHRKRERKRRWYTRETGDIWVSTFQRWWRKFREKA